MNEEFIVSILEDENDGDFSAEDLSLREAIAQAESDNTITFNSDLNGGTINLALGELAIDKSLTIQGLGAENIIIDADGNSRVFNVDDNSESESKVVINDLTITGGAVSTGPNQETPSGGGILNSENLEINNAIVRDNSAEFSGGGISSQGTLTVSNSTIYNNSAFRISGGGINNAGTATINQSTISSNTDGGLRGGNGGGIGNTGGSLTVNNSTVTENGSGIGNSGGEVTLTSTIVAKNLGNNDIEGDDFISGGNNFIGGETASFEEVSAGGFTNGENGDIVGSPDVGTTDNSIDPLLGELQDNGGSTPTIALLENSPAINAGSNPNNLQTDQRGEGFDRTVGEATDIGAFEVQDDGDGETPTDLVVSTLEDESDGDFSAGDLSLREAIALANEQEGADTITFASELSGGTITLVKDQSTGRPVLANTPLSITDSVTIDGLGKDNITIDGDNGGNGIFNLGGGNENIDVTVEGVTLANGAQLAFFFPGLSSPGGSFFVNENVNLILQDSVITGSGASVGGAIANYGKTSIIGSTITDSTSGDDAPASRPLFSNGVVANRGEMDITDSSISNNNSGGLTNAGILEVNNSNISNNNSIFSGGGIDNRNITIVSNSTISNNSANELGGGIFSADDAQTTILNSTITDNSSVEGSGVYNERTEQSQGTVSLTSTIIAGNSENQDLAGDGFYDSDGNNLIANAEGINGSFDSAKQDILGTADNPIDPQLGELQDNGGSTQTITLLDNSPAIDAGSNPNNLETDQRGEGFDRTVGEATDIGAFEVQDVDDGNGETLTDLVVSTLEDEDDGDFSDGDLSLREAIALANEQEGADTITFASDLSGGTIALSLTESDPRGIGEVNQDFDITDSVNIIGLGANNLTIDGLNGGNGIFKVSGENTNFNLEGLTIANGSEQRFFRFDSGGAGTIDFDGANLTLKDSVIVGGSGVFTGAISNSGNASIIGSTITDSLGRATEGSFATGVISNRGTLEIFNSTISNNISPGILNRGTLEISNSTISNNNRDSITNNSGSNLGSEIITTDGNTANITSSIISGNSQQDNDEFDDLSGEFTSGGNNLIGDGSGGFVNGENGDIVGTVDNPIDPLLGELQNNGGDTPTIALLDGSPAIDAGSNPNNLEFDQRGDGFDRTVGEATDIGAFEVQAQDDDNNGDGDAGDNDDGNQGVNLAGTEGDDSLVGGDFNDTISGLDGNDTLNGGARDDLLDGNKGNDLLVGGNGRDTLNGGDGHDTLDGGASDDLLFGHSGDDTLLGSFGRDTLDGGVGNDSLDGGTSDDELLGGDGHDTLIGGNGRDTLNGGSGDDVLTGGNSNDTFVLASEGGHDTITDFGRGNDVIALGTGIGFDDLSFSGHEIILGDSTLARLNSFDTTTLTQNDFVSI